MNDLRFRVHEVDFCVKTDRPEIAEAVEAFLLPYKAESPASPVAFEIRFRGIDHREEIPPSLSPQRCDESSEESSYDEKTFFPLRHELYEDQGQLVADFRDWGALRIDGPGRIAEGFLVRPKERHPQILSFLTQFTLIEMMKQEGLYTLHAVALEKNGKGALISGFGGKGKTTSGLSLMRSGYRCLSDDCPMIRENGDALEILSFPMKIDVTEKTIDLIPELKSARERLPVGITKRYFEIGEIFPQAAPLSDSCRPSLLLFPHVIDWPRTHLEPMKKSRALEALLPQGILVYDPKMSARHFQVLARLVETVDCYRLHLGEDFLDLPRMIDPLLAA